MELALAYLWLGLAIILNAAANIMIKLQASTSSTRATSFTGMYFILGVVFFGVALLAYRMVLAKLPLTVAYPVMTIIGLILLTGFSKVYFAEPLSTGRLVGIAMGVAAIVFIIRG